MSEAIVTEYQFRPLTEADTTDWEHWIVRVSLIDADADLWLVRTLFTHLLANGEWGHVIDSKAASFPLDEALYRAKKAQWTHTVNRKTAGDIINRNNQTGES